LVDGAKSVIAIGDYHLSVSSVSYEKKRRQRDALLDLLPVFVDVGVADTEQ
jgi:hypothetical protein